VHHAAGFISDRLHRSLKLIFDGHTHEQLLELFHRVGKDRENRVVILTGTGDAFMDEIRPEGFDFFSPRGYDRIRREGRKVLMNILDIEAPVFTALNGPVRLHAEYELLTDIVLATPETVFQDKPDGVNLLRPQVVGSMRGRYFLLTGQELDPRTARDWGAVNEIVPGETVLPRGHELADRLAALAPLTTRYSCNGRFVV